MLALQVDEELSPSVQRSFSLASPAPGAKAVADVELETILVTRYKATTSRMLRVAVNGFMESLSVILGVMEELDVDVLPQEISK